MLAGRVLGNSTIGAEQNTVKAKLSNPSSDQLARLSPSADTGNSRDVKENMRH
jgi:hypothetical protein